MKKQTGFDKKNENFGERHPLLLCIIIGIIVITGGGLSLILPIVLAIKISVWLLLLYLPIVGAIVGMLVWLVKEGYW